MKFLSVCSGIEAASVAWTPLGWKAWGFSEIEPFPCALLAHHYPDVPNFGDMTKFEDWPLPAHDEPPIDLLCGGPPCQSFSVAGLRKGLDDERGNLMLIFARIAAKYRPAWLVWENVPGVLSSNAGRDFASFLGLLSGQRIDPPREGWSNSGIVPGYRNAYGLAWRTLDAQYFGVAQRRRRVFVVGYLGDWRRAAAVLFERHSLSGDSAPRRETWQRPADPAHARLDGRSGDCADTDLRGDAQAHIATQELTTPETTGTLSARASAGGGLGTDFERNGGLVPEMIAGTLSAAGAKSRGVGHDTAYLCADITATLTKSALDGSSICGDDGRESFLVPEIVGTLDSECGGNKQTHQTAANGHLLAVPAITHSLRAGGHDASEDGTGRGTPLIPVATMAFHGAQDPDVSGDVTHPMAAQTNGLSTCIAFSAKDHGADAMNDLSPTLRAGGHTDSHANAGVMPAIAFHENQRGEISTNETAGSLKTSGGKPGQGYPAIMAHLQVRRLTPRECERLQGFPDNYTLIPNKRIKRVNPAKVCLDFIKYLMRGGSMTFDECTRTYADGPRYKALGNSWAVPCAAWIGQRINAVNAITNTQQDKEAA